jgi:hypothetical protein
MPKLTAKFDIPLGQCVFARYPIRKEIHIKIRIRDFIVDVGLLPLHGPSLLPPEADTIEVFCISTIRISVEGDTRTEIPPALMDRNGTDYSRRVLFFQEKLKIYREIATTALGRTITYFKYMLHTPLLTSIPPSAQALNNPLWYDKDNKEVDPGISYLEIVLPAGFMSSAFGVARLTSENENDLAKALENDHEIELYEEILSDAQSAVFQKNYRRAIVEMVMACEIAIKQTYFAKSTIAGRAYEYLENKHKVNASLIEYIGGIAEYVLGENFKSYSKRDYENIENLFRCRNKAVHRGELTYRDGNNKLINVDESVLGEWWESVVALLEWLKTKAALDQDKD